MGAVDRALQQVRSLSYLLHPPFAEDMGLLTAVRYYIEGVSQRTGIQVKAKLPEELQRLPFEMEAAIFRVVQESLTNIYRHSSSKTAEIELERTGETVRVKIRDYGEKAAEKAGAQRLGVGVSGMRGTVAGAGRSLQDVRRAARDGGRGRAAHRAGSDEIRVAAILQATRPEPAVRQAG